MDCTIRLARSNDLERINEIYNYFVVHSTCTYQEVPETMEARRAWFAEHDVDHPVTVAEVEGRVQGWGALSRFQKRSAYRFSTEDSVYVDREWHRRGLGGLILADLIARGRAAGHRTIIAGIDATQPGSVAVHAKFGFEEVARLKQVGHKFNRWLDVIYMQLMLAGLDQVGS
jgi:phosphinothricin acetyltransferase